MNETFFENASTDKIFYVSTAVEHKNFDEFAYNWVDGITVLNVQFNGGTRAFLRPALQVSLQFCVCC